ncbi:hypothetical protein D3C80_1819030 [compost metagenome]
MAAVPPALWPVLAMAQPMRTDFGASCARARGASVARAAAAVTCLSQKRLLAVFMLVSLVALLLSVQAC